MARAERQERAHDTERRRLQRAAEVQTRPRSLACGRGAVILLLAIVLFLSVAVLLFVVGAYDKDEAWYLDDDGYEVTPLWRTKR